jgi:hypothetical protein
MEDCQTIKEEVEVIREDVENIKAMPSQPRIIKNVE